jgi:hypothetical protein
VAQNPQISFFLIWSSELYLVRSTEHKAPPHSHHQASTKNITISDFVIQLWSQQFTMLKYYCLRCVVKLKLLELKWISVYCNKFKYYVITLLLKWQVSLIIK